MSKISDQQQKFTEMVARLIDWAYDNGYTLTFGEAYRTPEQAELYAKQGKGIANSLHCDRLAIDFNVFKDGEWLQSGDQFKNLGEYWESIGGAWGGRFVGGVGSDGGHFSLSYDGRK